MGIGSPIFSSLLVISSLLAILPALLAPVSSALLEGLLLNALSFFGFVVVNEWNVDGAIRAQPLLPFIVCEAFLDAPLVIKEVDGFAGIHDAMYLHHVTIPVSATVWSSPPSRWATISAAMP
jgi:hypothetical protein